MPLHAPLSLANSRPYTLLLAITDHSQLCLPAFVSASIRRESIVFPLESSDLVLAVDTTSRPVITVAFQRRHYVRSIEHFPKFQIGPSFP